MLILRREPTNTVDKKAVAVYKEDVVVGHVPYISAPEISNFVLRDNNKAFAKVVDKEVNRGVGYGLEIPCIYSLLWSENLLGEDARTSRAM